MNKVHEYRGGLRDILPLMKWLRTNGDNGGRYKLHHSNYNFIQVEFIDSKLELEYIMRYDWGRGEQR